MPVHSYACFCQTRTFIHVAQCEDSRRLMAGNVSFSLASSFIAAVRISSLCIVYEFMGMERKAPILRFTISSSEDTFSPWDISSAWPVCLLCPNLIRHYLLLKVHFSHNTTLYVGRSLLLPVPLSTASDTICPEGTLSRYISIMAVGHFSHCFQLPPIQ